MLRFENLNINNFYRYEDELIAVYLDAFTQGEHAQFITNEQAKIALERMIEKGFGFFAEIDRQIAGFILAFPLVFDAEFPKEYITNDNFVNALYIAEVLVGNNFRKQGMATELMKYVLTAALEHQYDSLVLRVWDENEPALTLYRKFGFSETGITIEQIKQKDDNETFVMRKIYMHKKIV